MSLLNAEQLWIAGQITDWPEAWLAATRGPFDQIINVYPRNCTKGYCITEAQWRSQQIESAVESEKKASTSDIVTDLITPLIARLNGIHDSRKASTLDITNLMRDAKSTGTAHAILKLWLKENAKGLSEAAQ